MCAAFNKCDEKKLNELLPKTGRNIVDRTRSSREIIKDIYGVKDGNVYEYGLAEALDEDDFNIKLQSLKDRWESLCPGFFNWFKKTRVSQFLKSVIQAARIGYDSEALYYQNDIESIHAVEKRKQCFKKASIATALSNIQSIVKREDEIRALYGTGNYVLALEFKRFRLLSHIWHSWSEERKKKHIEAFRNHKPTIQNTFTMPSNSSNHEFA